MFGSDPNSLPEFTIRGEGSIGMNRGLEMEKARRSQRTSLKDNPNLPIFIMDGFEVSVQKVYDMDINRIESMTILNYRICEIITCVMPGKRLKWNVCPESISQKAEILACSWRKILLTMIW